MQKNSKKRKKIHKTREANEKVKKKKRNTKEKIRMRKKKERERDQKKKKKTTDRKTGPPAAPSSRILSRALRDAP